MWKRVHLLVGDRHHGVFEFPQKLRDGLVGQERRHRGQQQVDEDEDDGEEVLQAGFAESSGWTASPDVFLCDQRRGKISPSRLLRLYYEPKCIIIDSIIKLQSAFEPS